MTEPTTPAQWIRYVVLVLMERLIFALITTGEWIVHFAGALDALIAARLGTRRITVIARELRDAVRESREENLL